MLINGTRAPLFNINAHKLSATVSNGIKKAANGFIVDGFHFIAYIIADSFHFTPLALLCQASFRLIIALNVKGLDTCPFN